MKQIFVPITSFWDKSPYFFAGPFATQAEAQAWIDTGSTGWGTGLALSGSTAENIRRDLMVMTPRSFTDCKRFGIRREAGEDCNVIAKSTPCRFADLKRAINRY
jgi:hypothetical protein